MVSPDWSGVHRGARQLQALVTRGRAVVAGLRSGITIAERVNFGPGVRVRVDVGGELFIASGAFIDEGCVLAVAAGARLLIGRQAFLGHHSTVSAVDRLEIGDGVYIAELVSIRDHDHVVGLPPAHSGLVARAVTVEKDAWLGSKVTVLRGCRVGAGSVVAANSVVTRDIPPGVLVAGSPAVVKRQLDPPAP